MKKSTVRFLSVLFHVFVLACMVMLYDAGKLLATKLGFIEGAADEAVDASLVDFSEKEAKKLSTAIDPELSKYIDKNDDGYVFRTDGPFPKHLKVVTTMIARMNDVKMATRVGDKSVNARLTTRTEEVMDYEIAGKAMRIIKQKELHERKKTAEERVERLKLLTEAKEKGIEPPADPDRKEGELVGKHVEFVYTDGGWKTKPTGEFKTMAWGKDLEEGMELTLLSNGLVPRKNWLGDSRIPVGHKVKLTGGNLSLIFDEVSKGELEMEFVAVEGVHGHPCGVFEFSGSVEMKKTTDDEGRQRKGEQTIERGKVWFSLLYPIVLRVKVDDAITSYEVREKGELYQQIEGKMSQDIHSEWKPVTATAKKKETSAPN